MRLKSYGITTVLLVLMVVLSFILFPNTFIVTSYGSASSLEVSVSVKPNRIQEGNHTTITVEIKAKPTETYTLGLNVTNPAGASSAINVTIETNAEGRGENATEYWKDFAADTSLVGVYSVAVMNVTTQKVLATTSFSVGLTDKLKYKRGENVTIQGAGYEQDEQVVINITLWEEQIKNMTMSADTKGVVYFNWTIPTNATPGNYAVSITSANTDGTEKSPSDVQNFYVEVWQFQIQALNLANEPVANLIIKAENQTWVPEKFLTLERSTNKTGWASFMLAVGNYTFKGLWKQIPAGIFPTNASEIAVENDIEIGGVSWVELLSLKITVLDEATGAPLPFVQLRFEYNYTSSELDKTVSETSYFETDLTGTVYVPNLFINSSYVVEASRYGVPALSLPPIQNKTTLEWTTITIKFPVYTAFVRVVDSEDNSVEGVGVEAYEWSSGLVQKETTGSDGKVTFSLTLGRYRVKVYNGTVLLNETVIDLAQNQSSFIISLSLYPIDFTVAAFDYFGQPIPNALVKIERKTDAQYETTTLQGSTGPDGRVTFSNILGGDLRILISVGGRLGGVKEVYLASSEQVTFHLAGFVVVAGYPVESSQLVTVTAIAMLIAVFVVALTYKRLLKIFRRSR